MFDHVEIHVSDLAASRAFYGEALGLPTFDGELLEWGDFGITPVSEEHPLTRNLHIAFGAEDRAAVDAWWNRMTEAGYESDGEPGPRPQYSADYYGAFVVDPDGNSVEAVHHGTSVPREIDHLWLRTRDVAAIRRFYVATGREIGIDEPDWVQIVTPGGTISFVAGEPPTEHVHIAFGVDTNEAVDAFHRAATGAGYADNGAPGERAAYHPGYYGAFVLDPDGHNIEAVNHTRS